MDSKKNSTENQCSESQIFFALDLAREDTRHAENVTQTRMYNFLFCDSILILSWVTVFVASPQSAPPSRPYALVALAVLSLFLSIAYALFGRGATKFIRMHYDISLVLESQLPQPLWTADPIVALQRGKEYICKSKYQNGEIIRGPRPRAKLHTGYMLTAVPISFALLSIVLVVLSVCIFKL